VNLFDLVDARAREAGGRAAVWLDDGHWTWESLRWRACAASARLADAGVRPGTVVAQAFASEPLQLVAMLATARLGATVFGVSAGTPAPRRARMLREVGATVLATDLPGAPDEGLRTVRLEAGPDDAAAAAGRFEVAPTAPWIIGPGSGSTGRPKYLPITHRQQLARLRHCDAWLPYGEDEVLLSLVGLDFQTTRQRCLEAFARGASILLTDRERLDLRAAASAGRYTVLNGTVYHFERLLQRLPERGPPLLGPLRALMIGGSTVSERLRTRLRERLCPRLQVRYGANECGTICSERLEDPETLAGGVGRPLPGIEVQVVDALDRPLPPGTAGSVRVRGDACIDGYLGDPEATARAFRDGWFYPGDLARTTPDGQLVHLGRADDLMIVNGINVHPAEIEQVLLSHDAVQQAVARPLRHAVHQHVPVAAVVLRPGARAAEETLLAYARARLGAHALHRVFVLDELPFTERGKPHRRDLEAALAARLRQPPAGSAPEPAPREARPRQLSRRVTATFALPPAPDPATLDAWLEVLEDDLPPPVAPTPAHAASAQARAWLVRCLRLARRLLQALRVPVFDAPRVLECTRQSAAAPVWRARVELALPEDLPPELSGMVLTQAFGLAEWAAARPPDAEAREAFFTRIARQVLEPCAGFRSVGKSTFQVLHAAHRMGIPFRSLGGGVHQLGWGARGRRIERSTTDGDSAIGARQTHDKALTARLLRAAGLPAPRHEVVTSVDAALAAARRIGWPVVVKPVDLDRGEGVTVDVDVRSLPAAFEEASRLSPGGRVLVERQVSGVCHRLFVAGGRLLYAVERLPMGVQGDGVRSVAALVADACAAQLRRPPWLRSEIRPLDALARKAIEAAGLDERSVPAAGRFVPLRRIESTAWGGVDLDATARVHPENLRVALAAAALFRLEVAGVDLLSPDVSVPWHANGAVINEVNHAPLLGGGEISRTHLPEYLRRLLGGGDGRIPVEVYCGGEAAWVAARERWNALREAGPGVHLSSAAQTLDGEGRTLPMPLSGLCDRVRALVLSPRVHAIVMVVQTDELLRTGLPLERVDRVVMVDRALESSTAPSRPLAAARLAALGALLARWQRRPASRTAPARAP
jgi:acyl-coenzyme A synthetase/AMP-(fatty) acid ligase/D-alanine-D-alanine ligase-like ATP-grasp enzyme